MSAVITGTAGRFWVDEQGAAHAEPAPMRARSNGRFYVDAKGQEYWSVTTLLKAVPKDALVYWSAKEAAIFAVDNLERIQLVIGDGDGRDAAIDLIKNACWRNSAPKMNLGTLVHKVIESLVLDTELPTIEPDAARYVDQFLKFDSRFNPTWLASELPVYNRTRKYAGTLDLIGRVADRTLLIDIKTGKCRTDRAGNCLGPYPDVALQLAPYRYAEYTELADGTQVAIPAVDGGAVLHLAPDHFTFVPVVCDEEIFDFFLHAVEMYRWLNEVSKTVVGEPIRPPLGIVR